MAYVDSMIATAGIPEVPAVPSGQLWARETGQWVPISNQTGVFLPLGGGTMQGQINMGGNAITNLPALPVMPNGAAPATWVLNQIAAQTLYQGTWNMDTYTPDLTQPATHQNGFTWIAITTSSSGVVIAPAIPGLQGQTIFNGDTVIYSAIAGQFQHIHSGGVTIDEGNALWLQLAGGQLSGPLLLNANATQPTQAVTLQQLQAFVPPGVVPEAPNDGQLYGRNGLTAAWSPVLPLAGGILTGMLTLSGNATANLNPVPLQQMTSAITAATAGYLPLAGGTMSGLMSLSGNATGSLNPVPLQQINSMLGVYLPRAGVTDGSNAPAGQIGEIVVGASGSSAGISPSTPINVIAITLSPGDWDVWGEAWFTFSTTNPGTVIGSINIVSNTLPTGISFNTAFTQINVAPGVIGTTTIPLGPCRQSLTVSTPVYVVAEVGASSVGGGVEGKIMARRVR
jgi:hypothetical protein